MEQIVVPIAMLRNHIASNAIRPTPAPTESQDTDCAGPTLPASEASQRRVPDKRFQQPLAENLDHGDSEKEPAVQPQVDEDDEYIDYDAFIARVAEESDADTFGINSRDVSLLQAAIFEAEEAESGKPVLSCENLDDAPMPQDIKNLFSVVLGDIYHAMNRAKVPVKHEVKKAYFHALRNAFLIWNPKKVEEFESKMRKDGVDEKEIDAMKYFKPHLYDECIERHAPAPRILYYRVRAVFALFGNMVDSKTKKPLFNAAAWRKANEVLKEILHGYYSDPPGTILYSKKMKSDGRVMRNKYGMELVECFRGTNRVEAYHKKLHPIVKSKNCGVKMAAFLLAEMRHRHNQHISELRRGGFPVLGHYSTHKIDQLQELYLHNHGCVLYPGWDSASAYKPTDESFDTIALHHSELQDALKTRREQLGDVKLTKDLQYMCDAMGVPLPFLPFSGKDGKAECQLFAKLMLMHKGTLDDAKFALEWCKHVDPEQNIHAKLPCHIRVQATILEESNTGASPAAVAIPPSTNATPSQKRKALTAGLSHSLQEAVLPRPFPIPPPQALSAAPYVIHGNMMIGRIPLPAPMPIAPMSKTCTLCLRNGGIYASTCPGRGSHNHCVYYETNNTPKPARLQKARQRGRRICKLILDTTLAEDK
mmetsp:Transcript_1037/g.2176  ORF Transcript_1037/g.2176 Transcript_1037/m.2176 type:complete len:649 (-) Transcript_1037:533-2479(-)